MGNFSRDTFDRLKHYVSVRLQQGVPVVDADWNELQDIRTHELETFLKWFVGDGVPLGNDGFAVGTVVDGNDFSIAAGHCLVEGWTVVNENVGRYEEQTEVPPLVTPPSDRTDTVYLDVWEREVDAEEDPAIVNPGIGIETCVRTKREWVVRVAEGATELPAPPPGHVFYPLATLNRKAGQDVIDDVTDLRRTGLTLASLKERVESLAVDKVDRAGDRITGDLAVDGRVGIGITTPRYPLDIARDESGGFTGLSIQNPNLDQDAFAQILLASQGGGRYLRMTRQADLQILGHNQNPLVSFNSAGNVGIGTPNPAKDLHIQGIGSGPLCNDGNDRPGLAITGTFPELDLFSGGPYGHHGPTIRLGGYNDETKSSFRHWVIGTAGRNAHFLDFGFSDRSDPNPHFGIRNYGGGVTVLTLNENGSVWAGTRTGGGVDYAEYFESSDGKEILAGTAVVLEEDKIRSAREGEVPIGIISANPGIVGGVHIEWPGKYLRDEFSNRIMEEYEEESLIPKKDKVTRERQKVEKKTIEEEVTRTEIVLEGGKYLQKEITETVTREVEEPVFEEVDLYDATGKTVIGKHRVPVMETYEEEIDVMDDDGRPVLVGTGKFETKERPKLNPDYDESNEYVPREKRPEWNCVGLLGKLPLCKGQPVAESWIKMKDISDEVELWLVK